MGMSFWRFWYLRHFDSNRLYEELSRPAKGEYVVVHDSPTMATRVRKEHVEEYMRLAREDEARRRGAQ